MRKFFKLLLVAVLAAPGAISCSNDESPDGGTSNQTPDIVESKAQTSEGVSIRSTNISSNDFTLNLEMGADCPAYRFEVVPLIKFKNDLMEARKSNPSLDEEKFIIDRLFNTPGVGFALNTSIDVPWSESLYTQAQIIHGIDYIVLTVGCIDEEANVVAEVNTLTIPLKTRAVIGNPKAKIDLTTTSTGFEAAYTMNTDSYAYYSFETVTDAVDEALKEFGEKGLRELICCFMSGPNTEDFVSSIDWGYNAVAGAPITVLTVALDANGTLANTYSRADDVLKEDSHTTEAKYTVTITGSSALTVASYWNIDYEVTSAVFYRVFKPEDWKKTQDSYTERQIQIQLVDEGYGINHLNDPAQLIWSNGIEPDTEYIMVSTARNKGMQLTKLLETPFKTKAIVKNTPEQSLAQVSAEKISVDKTTMGVEYTIPTGTTLYFDCVLEKGSKDFETGLDLTDPANKAQLIDYLLANGNVATYVYTEGYVFNGLDPAKAYCYFLVAEDENGVVGPLYTFDFNTDTNIGGENPGVAITGMTEKLGDGSYQWNLDFKINGDVTTMLYCTQEDPIAPNTKPSEAKINEWTNYVIEIGLTSIGSSSLSVPVTESSTMVALALPYGNNNLQGELHYLIFDSKTMMSSLLPVKAISKVSKMNK